MVTTRAAACSVAGLLALLGACVGSDPLLVGASSPDAGVAQPSDAGGVDRPDATTPLDAGLEVDSGDAGTHVIVFGEGDDATERGATYDTRIEDDYVSQNFGTDKSLGVGDQSPFKVSLLRFKLTAVPPAATVIRAELRLSVSNGTGCNDSNPVGVYPVFEDWADNIATWNKRAQAQDWTAPGCGAPESRAADPVATFTPDTGGKRYSIELPAELVAGWITQPLANHGIALVIKAGSGRGACFVSSEGAPALQRPSLAITYQ